MSIRHIFIAAAAVLFAGAANAAIDDVTSANTGTLATPYSFVIGTGTINESVTPGANPPSEVFGIIPAQSVITLTYNLSQFAPGSTLEIDSANNSFGTASANSFGSTSSSNPALILASANITTTPENTPGTGTMIIKNFTLSALNFATYLFGITTGGAVTGTVQVSAVPLPASAQLFGLGLALLAGYGMMKRKRQDEV